MAIDILSAFEKEPPPLDFVLPGLLAGTVGAIVSPGGAGKSLLALELSVLTASGLDLSGFGGGVVRPIGKVAFMAAEDPADAIVHRLHSLGGHIDSEHRELVAKNMVIEPLAGLPVNIMEPASLAMVESLAVGRRLMFFDTLRRFHQLDENDSGQMAQLIGVLEGIATRTGCALVFLHHSSKSAAMNGQGDMQQASRGSSVLVDNVRWQMYLAGCSKDEAKAMDIEEEMRKRFVRAGVSKVNYGGDVNDTWLRRMDGGVLVKANLSNHFGSVKPKRAEKEVWK